MSDDYITLPDTVGNATTSQATLPHLFVASPMGVCLTCSRGPLDRAHATKPLTWTATGGGTYATKADLDDARHQAMSAYVDLGAALDAFRREAGLWLAGIAVCLAAIGGGLLVLAVLR